MLLNDRRSLDLNLPSVTVNIFDRQMIGTLQNYWLMSTSSLASDVAVWSLRLRRRNHQEAAEVY